MISGEHNFPPEQIQDFEERITYMETMMEVMRWPSCAKIMVYLTIHGKLRASQLRDLLGLKGEKSVFKSLKVLQDTGFVEKEMPSGERNALYMVNDQRANDPDFDDDFIRYLVHKGKYDMLADYLSSANRASSAFLEAATDIMKQAFTDYREKDMQASRRFLDDSLFFEIMFSIEDSAQLKQDLYTFIREKIGHHLRINPRKPGVPMKNPAALYISYMPLSSIEE